MFELSLPWWELMLRAVAVYGALLLMVRVSGKRSIGQFTPFDLLVVMLLSESVSNGLSGGDDSLAGGLLLAATLIACNGAVGFAASRSRRLENLIDGTPVLIGRDGRIFSAVLKAHRLGAGDVEQALREADCAVEDLHLAVLEADGSISVVKRKPA